MAPAVGTAGGVEAFDSGSEFVGTFFHVDGEEVGGGGVYLEAACAGFGGAVVSEEHAGERFVAIFFNAELAVRTGTPVTGFENGLGNYLPPPAAGGNVEFSGEYGIVVGVDARVGEFDSSGHIPIASGTYEVVSFFDDEVGGEGLDGHNGLTEEGFGRADVSFLRAAGAVGHGGQLEAEANVFGFGAFGHVANIDVLDGFGIDGSGVGVSFAFGEVTYEFTVGVETIFRELGVYFVVVVIAEFGSGESSEAD